MDCSCNCCGIAASSKVPVKRYNVLVPDIFPRQPPDFNAPLDASIVRKIKKLVEYVDLNPHRTQKVSRRLARTINKELRKPKNHGQVKLAVEAYIQLFLKLRPDDSSLLTREVILQPVSKTKPPSSILDGLTTPHFNSVVGVLLRFPEPKIKILGANLLTAFIQSQRDSEYVKTVDHFVPLLAQTVEDTLRGHALPLDGASPQTSLASACLTALRQYISYSNKMSFASQHLDKIEACLLDVVRGAPSSAVQVAPLLNGSSVMLPASTQGASPTSSVHSALTASEPSAAREPLPHEVAVKALQDLFLMTKDAADGRRVLQGCLHYMDRGQHWQDKDGVLAATQRIMDSVFKEDQQRYMWYSSLIRHVAAPGLSPDQRASVLATAGEEAKNLQDALASPALVLALKKLPEALPAEGQSEAEARLRGAILDSIKDWAGHVGNSLYLLEAIGAVLAKLPLAAQPSLATLDCMLPAAQAISSFPPEAKTLPSNSFPEVQLRELTSLITNGEGPIRERACRLLTALLPLTSDGLTASQAHNVFSALWYATVKLDASPRDIAAIDALLGAMLAKSSPETILEAAKLALTWQDHVIQLSVSGGKDSKLRERLGLLSLSSNVLERIYRAASGLPGGAPAPPATAAPLPGSQLRLGANGQLAVDEESGPAVGSTSGAAVLAAIIQNASAKRADVVSRLRGSRLFNSLESRGLASSGGGGAEGRGRPSEGGIERLLAEPFQVRSLRALQPRASDRAALLKKAVGARLLILYSGSHQSHHLALGSASVASVEQNAAAGGKSSPQVVPAQVARGHETVFSRRRSSVQLESRGLRMTDLTRLLSEERNTKLDTDGFAATFADVANSIARNQQGFSSQRTGSEEGWPEGNGLLQDQKLATPSREVPSGSAATPLGAAAILGAAPVFNLASSLDGPPRVPVV